MQSANLLLLLSVALCLFGIESSWGAHKDKFRTCSSSSFCGRQRRTNEHSFSRGYKLVPHSVRAKENTGFEALFEELKSGKQLLLRVNRVISDIIHIHVNELDELNSNVKKRYEVSDADDVLMRQARNAIPFTSVHVNENADEYKFAWNDYVLWILFEEHSFFKMRIAPKHQENASIVTVNDLNTFYFEPMQEKREMDGEEAQEAEDAEDAEEGIWEESFSGHTYYHDNGATSVGLDFTFDDTVHLYGLPEHASSFLLKDTICNDENDDSSSSSSSCYSEPYRLYNLDVFEYELDSSAALYGAIPFVIGHSVDSTVGILWLNPSETYVDIETLQQSKRNTHFMSESGVLEAFIILNSNDGNVNGVLKQYSLLTGYPQLPPMFALGHHQCRWNYISVEDVLSNINAKFDELNIPTDVIWLDIEHTDGKKYFTWDMSPSKFANASLMLAEVKKSGRKMVCIVDPHIKKDSGYYIYNDIKNKNLFVKDRNSEVYDGFCWPGTSNYPDFLNPEMQMYWQQQFAYDRYAHSTDTLFIWNDMAEPSVFSGPEISMPVSNIHFDGRNYYKHGDVHNLYGYYVHQATFNGLLARDGAGAGAAHGLPLPLRPFVLSRSFFAGSQKYGAIWTGDNTATFAHLRASIPMLLSISIAGLPFCGADIGGFFNNPDGELMSRWYEVGAFYPFFRNHAHQDTKRRELWQFDDEHSARMKNAILLRYRLLPYLYSMFYLAFSEGMPVMRPLWYSFPEDSAIFDRDDSFMFGGAFYIHPIVEAGASSLWNVYLPTQHGAHEDEDEDEHEARRTLYYETNNYNSNAKIGIFVGGHSYNFTDYQIGFPVLRLGGSIVLEKHRVRRSASLQKFDPLSIFVCLDDQGNANGLQYSDDEESLYHASRLQFITSRLTFTAETVTLANRVIHSANTKSKPGTDSRSVIAMTEIERIIIVAEQTRMDAWKADLKYLRITQHNRVTKSNQFGFGTNTIVIKYIPNLYSNHDFKVQFVF